MEIFSSYNVIIGISLTIILSFIFNGIAKKTNIPAVFNADHFGNYFSIWNKSIWWRRNEFFPDVRGSWDSRIDYDRIRSCFRIKIKTGKISSYFKNL